LEFYFDGEFEASASAWLMKNDQWIRTQVSACSTVLTSTTQYADQDCAYWYQVGLILSQMDGMVQGYNAHCADDQHLGYNIFLYLNANADIGDIMTALDPSSDAKLTGKARMVKLHCSVLVKYSSEERIYHSHVTWTHYVNMLRTYKHYTFNFQAPSTASKTVSFSSSPGFIASGDDYFITDTGLIVTETTNDVFNMSLYNFVTPASVLYWIRVCVANRMATNGSEWASIFAKYNSGTYNNQWQITDTKLFTPGQPLQPETLFILEQIPGYIESGDVTFQLDNYGYFPSYNIPYFPFIFNMSGYPAMVAQGGAGYTYESNPRANIFRRDQGNVVTLENMQDIMRSNNYQTDPFSLGDPCNAISARCDLNSTYPIAFGGMDCKVSDTMLIRNMTTTAISGPTTLTQPPFQWDTPAFEDIPHYGQPTLFDFAFVNMQPQQLV